VREVDVIGLSGDLPPRSVRTGRAVCRNESIALPATAATGTRMGSPARCRCCHAGRPGIATRSRLRAEGRHRREIGIGWRGGGLNTKLSKLGRARNILVRHTIGAGSVSGMLYDRTSA